MFDEKYLKPLSGQIEDIQKQKQQVDNEIESICLQILNNNYDNIDKLSQQPMIRLADNIGEILVAYHYYIVKTKSESVIFKNIIESIFNYIIENDDCNMVNVMRQLKLQLSQVSKSMESHTYNKDMFDLVSSYYNYLCEKESEIEKKRLRVEFINTDNDLQELIYNMAELEGKLKESSELLDEGLKDAIMKTKANIAVADRKISGRIDSIADKIFGQIKSAKDEDERERIIRNSIPKASSIIKKAITTGMVALINPAIALISLLASIAVNKKTREVQRKLILNELQTESKIVEEKIRDAESDGDKKKKYELMRIQAKLQKDIERIRYNLKY